LTLTDFLFNPNDPGRRSIHEVERYAALAGLAIRQDPATHLSAAGPLRLFLPPLAEQAAKTWMAQHVPAGMLPVALHLSAKWAGEGWPDSTCIDLARSLLDRFPALFLLVTAGPGESRFWTGANTILPQGRVQLMEKLEFADWAALLSQCRALVTMDTGSVHLAAAVATPVVDVFPVMNFLHASSRWAPWQVSHRIVQRPSPEQATDFAAEIQAALEALL
jgi:ADP-heptose:LPS heptosyltransferase